MLRHRSARITASALLFASLLASLFPGLVQPALAADKPVSVTIPGTIQSKLGCSGDWQPDCAKTHLTYDPTDDLWQGEWDLPAGDYEYKAAINDSWTVNYGKGAAKDGPNIPLSLAAPVKVKFYYDDKTHWVTDNHSSIIASAAGIFQKALGCSDDWQPDCLRIWLQDPDGDGIYTFLTTAIPAGSYEAKVAINESWDENYGKGGEKNGANIPFTVASNGAEILFSYSTKTHVLTIGAPQKGSLAMAQAQWVTRDTIAWNVPRDATNSYKLFYAPDGGMTLEPDGLKGGQSITLAPVPGGLSDAVLAKFPNLRGYTALQLGQADVAKVPDILKGQMAVQYTDVKDKLQDATLLQIPGVLDDLNTYNGALGVVFDGGVPGLKVWAPTARSVKLQLFNDSNPASTATVLPMAGDSTTGVWSIKGDASWLGKYYLYEVEVYVNSTGKVEHNLVTDPYSISLSTNSQRSQIVNLDDKTLQPAGWVTLKKPPLAAPEDITLYELHVRDFSINDQTVPEAHRGTFLAFTDMASNGMKHLKELAQAGLTHVHLLPVFDIATINEDKSQRVEPDPAKLATYPPDSDQQQAAVAAVANNDGFNWGYDPWHYDVPEGSYSTNPDGPTRILEFRDLVQGLNSSGLRVVMDVVYNHTTASGQDPKSVLDQVVPGYYQRLDNDGAVETSTCCANTATEHNMMGKLMVDSVVMWAKEYKIDGFRFDLMGHHMKSNMEDVRKALDALTPAKDGVDGSKIYIYGEGWNFGEVADNARGVNATQLNMAGTGIGTFNDRIRDAARGGGPFSDPQEQGFLTGLLYAPNAAETRTTVTMTQRLLQYEDWIKIGLAGNLKDYKMIDMTGQEVTGADISYNGQPAGYTADPQEDVNYVEAHDNETLWDAIAYKVPVLTSVADRVRMQDMGMDLVALGEGVPFFHAGVDMLRSKDMDGNSYNSGDWFNKLDFTYQSNNWGIGLPDKNNNGTRWNLIEPLVGNPALKPAKSDILNGVAHFEEMLRIRKSSGLFRLETAADIEARVQFLNNGPNQIPGLIVMSISDAGVGTDLDPQYAGIVVLFNGTNKEQTFSDVGFVGRSIALHPVQAASKDPVVRGAKFNPAAGSFTVPPLTTAVFVQPQKGLAGTVPGMPKTGEEGGDDAWLLLVCAGLMLLGSAFVRLSEGRASAR